MIRNIVQWRLIFLVAITLSAITSKADLKEGLVSYWPLDEIQGSKTPDLISGYDMEIFNLTSDDVVEGRYGSAFSFENARNTILSRIHEPGDDLPANKHESFSISMWVNVAGQGQNDLRVFSEGSDENNNPLFNIGTHNQGANGTVDFFIRNSGWSTVGHIYSEQEAFDSEWRHLLFVQDGPTRSLYVDGQLDSLAITDRPEEGEFPVNNTSIGGIQRSVQSHWVTGLIDEVAIWKRALTEDDIAELNDSGMDTVLPPLARGLVSHWPLDEMRGTKTPDIVSGYDMDIFNLTEDDVVEGKNGNAFSFDNARNTMLSRVHNSGEKLPANQHSSFTISMWVNVAGQGQNDLRVFSEGSTLNNNPLFNIGTHNQGADGTVDFFIRNSVGGWGTVNHIHSDQEAFDGEWRHLVYMEDGGARSLYIDGSLDSLEIAERPEGEFPVNNTSIGGIQRSVQSHWVTGLIDDVAIWNRALTEDEIAEVGVAVPEVPEPPPSPLKIAFGAEYSSVASGSNVLLTWEVNPDVVIDIQPGIGNVNGSTEFGTGSIEAQVDEDTTFTMTITRDDQTLEASVTVLAVSGVAEGWSLVENFEALSGGQINGQGRWKNAEGRADVIELGGNNVISPMGNNALSNLKLGSFESEEDSESTLFFRFYLDNSFSPGGINIGLTEKTLRFASDAGGNLGPYVRINKAEGFVPAEIQARNGVGGAYESAPDIEVESGKVYNVWVDITNDTIENGDLFQVYFNEDGEDDRVLIFEDFIGDRNPAGSGALGAVKPNLTDLFIVSRDGTTSGGSFFFDDFYLSLDGLLDTVPVAAQSFERQAIGEPADIMITNITRDEANDSVDLTFTSVTGGTYKVLSKAQLQDSEWKEELTEIAGEPDSTTVTVEQAGDNNSFYVISGTTPAPDTSIFFEDFENGQGDWETGATLGDNQWEIGTPDLNLTDSAFSGSNAFATNLDGNYDNDSTSYLRSPVIDLTDVTSAVFSFQTVFDSEETFDFCYLRIVDENGEEILDNTGFPIADLIDFLSFTGTSGEGWKKVSKPIPAAALGRTIRLEFQLEADPFENAEGWAVDDIRID